MKIEIQIPFSGFYDSVHDQFLDYTLDRANDVDGDEEKQEGDGGYISFDSVDWQAMRKEYSKNYLSFYIDKLSYEHDEGDYADLLESLTFKEIDSPREYNFTNDRFICEIDRRAIRRIYAMMLDNVHGLKDNLELYIKERFASYNGFISFYSNDINEWLVKPFPEWDLNELSSLFCAYVHNFEYCPFEADNPLLYEMDIITR